MRGSLACLLASLAPVACTANDDIPAPAIASVTPNQATPGTPVVIAGSYFCQQTEAGSGETDPLACRVTGAVLFGTAQTDAQQYTDTSITVDVPQLAAGTVSVAVTVAGRVSNSVDFQIE
jgi:hypothetical protein